MSRPVSIQYLTGFFAEPFERLMALVVRRDGATLVVPAIEREKASAFEDLADVVSWRDGEDPWALVRSALEGCRAAAVEKDHLSVLAGESLAARTSVREIVDAGPEIRDLRRIKGAREIEMLQRAAAITDAAGEEVVARLRGGESELEVAQMIASAVGELGGLLSFDSLVQSGPNSALPHLRPTSRRLERGEFLLLDYGAKFEGYHADTTRMFIAGDASEKHREVHQVVLDAHDAAVAAVRAGVTTGDVDAAARRVVEAAGYGDRFFHRVGHGIGLEPHEEPSLDPGSSTVLEAGMTFTIEPGIYIPGWGGVRIEDDVAVEDGGCSVLTKADRSLRSIPLR